MNSHPFFQALVPHNPLGWIGRWLVLITAMFGLSVLRDLVVHQGFVSGLRAYLSDMLLLGGPFAIMILGAAAQFRERRDQVQYVRDADPLTGLLNRHAFSRKMNRALPQSGVLIVLGINDLRKLNQQHGDAAGDLCLMALAQQCREVTRKTDILGRLDGSMFAVYLPGATAEAACALAERLRDIQITTANGTLRASTCVGAVFADGCTPLVTLLAAGDAAVVQAKRLGQSKIKVKQLSLVA